MGIRDRPYQGHKKGADGGIDGLIFFHDSQGPAQKIIVSVKGGATDVRMIREFARVIDREGAAMGLFVTLMPPTKPMKAEAAAVGFYQSPSFPGRDFPKLQILTIDGLLNKTEQARHPDLSGGTATFKQAPPHVNDPQQGVLF